jgi:hypothetical protein
MTKLWIDDIRPAPPGWIWAKTPEHACFLLFTYRFDEVSFDNDLGGKIEGRHIANLIERKAFFGQVPRLKWSIHSANPVGRKAIQAAMLRADVFWLAKEISV